AVDRGAAICTRLRCRYQVRLGLRLDWSWNTCSRSSSAKARGRWVLSVCAKPDVFRILGGMDRSLVAVWPGKPYRAGDRSHRAGGGNPVCSTLRGTDAAEDVRCGVR